MHVLVHEVGHALGLTHEHGSITAADDGTVASPMVSTYAWGSGPRTEPFDANRTACGRRYPPRDERDVERYLSFSFSNCAREALGEYRGGIRP